MAVHREDIEELTVLRSPRDPIVLPDAAEDDLRVATEERPEVIVLPSSPAERPGRGFGNLLVATAVSNLGDGIRTTAFPLLAASLTRDPILISGTVLATHLPWLLLSLVGGALVDRMDRRRLMIGVDVLRAVLMTALAVAVFADAAALPLLYAVAFLQGTGEVLFDNATYALVPSLVPGARLEQANGRLNAIEVTTNLFAGPALGGLLFAAYSPLPFVTDAASFALGAALVWGIKGRFRAERAATAPSGLRAEIREGLAWLWRNPLLRNLSLIAASTNLVLHATFAIFVLYALEVLGVREVGFGLLLSVEAFGGVAGSLLAHRISKRLGRSSTIVVALLFAGVSNLTIGVTSSILVVGAASMALTFCGATWNVVTNSMRQVMVPDRLLGRVQSAHRLLSWGAIPVGALLGGVVYGMFGARAPFLVAAVVLCGLAGTAARLLGRSVDDGVPVGAEARA